VAFRRPRRPGRLMVWGPLECLSSHAAPGDDLAPPRCCLGVDPLGEAGEEGTARWDLPLVEGSRVLVWGVPGDCRGGRKA